MFAFERAAAHLVGAVVVVHVAAQHVLHLGAECALGVGSEEGQHGLCAELAEVAAELLAARLGQAHHVFGERAPEIGAVIEGDFHLPPARRHRAGAGGQRQNSEIVVHRLVHAPAQIAERERYRDLHHVAGPGALQIERARRGESVELPFLRPVERRPRFAGGAAGGLHLERRRRAFRRTHIVEFAERRILDLVLLHVVGVVGRDFVAVVDVPDVSGFESGRLPALAVERIVPPELHASQEALVLQRAHPFRRPLVDRIHEHVGNRIVPMEPSPVDGTVVDRQVARRKPVHLRWSSLGWAPRSMLRRTTQ